MNAVTRLKRWLNTELLHLAYNWQRVAPVGRPVVFQIELTNHCPMTCLMCPRTTQMTRALGYMSEDTYTRVLDQIEHSTAQVFLHHFGDSLVHPAIGRFIHAAATRGIKTYLSANPILLTEPRIRAVVDNGLEELVLSLDGASAETSEIVRGPAARNVALAEEHVRALLDYKRQTRKRKPDVILQIVRQKQNAHEVDGWVEKWRGTAGLKRLKIKSYITWDGTNDRINLLRIELPRRPSIGVCHKPWTSITILWDGRVVPCCFDYDAIMTLGDARLQSLDEIWTGPQLTELRRCHRDDAISSVTLCARCTDKEWYPVRKWYYPFNRILGTVSPVGAEMSYDRGDS